MRLIDFWMRLIDGFELFYSLIQGLADALAVDLVDDDQGGFFTSKEYEWDVTGQHQHKQCSADE